MKDTASVHTGQEMFTIEQIGSGFARIATPQTFSPQGAAWLLEQTKGLKGAGNITEITAFANFIIMEVEGAGQKSSVMERIITSFLARVEPLLADAPQGTFTTAADDDAALREALACSGNASGEGAQFS